MNRTTLKKLLKSLTKPAEVDFSAFDNEVTKLKNKLQQEVTVKTLEDVNVALEQNRKRINFEPLTQAFDELKNNIETKNEELLDSLDSKNQELGKLIQENDNKNLQRIDELRAEIDILSARKVEIPDFGKQIKQSENKLVSLIESIQADDEKQDKEESDKVQKQFLEFEKTIKDLRLSLQHRGGGNMNRNIAIGGNASVLSKYTDINIKAGSNVTLIYSNNNTTKYLDLTISASGGGGSVGGVVRSIATTTVSSTIGAVSGTDYVVLANGGLQITLPDATANTNLYTIKNIGSSSVLVNTTSAQTIDGQTTVIMPVQYTSIDLISDSANWEIT